jgi:hypothetical protein
MANFAFDERHVAQETCEHCGAPSTRIKGFVLRNGDAYAIYLASCYHHDGHEVWIDVVFSPTWLDDADDRYTFGCRVGPVEGQDEPAATMVDAAAVYDDTPTFGRKLRREEGLAHPQCDEFWALIDHLLVSDPQIAAHMGYADPSAPRWKSVLGRVRARLGSPSRHP